jgi:hypothetical protein
MGGCKFSQLLPNFFTIIAKVWLPFGLGQNDQLEFFAASQVSHNPRTRHEFGDDDPIRQGATLARASGEFFGYGLFQ